MSFIYKLRLLPVASLLFSIAAAQTCYYPDGLTVSTDVVCNSDAAASACCPEDSFCMSNGLCMSSGVVSRGSCTDSSWSSSECAAYCETTERSSSISLTPCDNSGTFACGLNNTACSTDSETFTVTGGDSLVLRPAQIAALTSLPSSGGQNSQGTTYQAGALIGVGLGVGVPLLIALVLALLVLRKERQRNALQALYKKPEVPAFPSAPAQSRRSFSTISRSGTMTTIESTYKPQSSRSGRSNKGFYAQETELGVPVYELPSNPPTYSEQERVEAP